MSIKLELPKLASLRPRIMVVGVGGAGGNAVNNMILSGLQGVNFAVANTDAQALQSSSAETRIQLGANLTEGLGAGSRPEIGEAAAEEALEDIRAQVSDSHMLFIAAGMGGGTGTGAAAVIARIAKEAGVLTVGIVTKPFQFEGTRRARIADAGIAELKKYVDTLIVIPNQNLFRIANEKTTFAEAFVLADQVLYSGIACIVDLIVKDGLINLDFADVRTIMKDMGTAVMGTGEGEGDRRAIEAAEEAIANPLLDDVSLKGAKGLLLSITGSRNMTLYEVDEAASRVRQEVDPEANIIVGATFDDTLGDRVRVSIVASGMSRAGDNLRQSPAPVAEARTGVTQTLSAQAPAAAAPASAPQQVRQEIPAVVPPAPMFNSPAPPQSTPVVSAQTLPRAERADHDELSRRLSAAFELGTASGGYQDQSQEPDEVFESSSIAGEPWRAPGDVMIEEAPPRSMTSAPPLPSPLSPAPPHQAQSTGIAASGNGMFEPARPQDIRRGQRRMPEVEDFPAVGQREYLAKSGREGEIPPPLPAAQHREPRSQDEPNRRKPGLLARLTGRAKGVGDSPPAPPSYSQASRQQGAGSPHERARTVAQPGDGRDHRRTQGSVDDVDLPVFFGGDRK